MPLSRLIHARRLLPFVALSALVSVAAALPAQVAPPRRPLGLGVSADWLQANALPMDRDAIQSGAIDVSLRRDAWSLDGGWRRIARELSTVQGGTLSIGRVLPWRAVNFIPSVGLLVGQVYSSRDTTGYDFVGTGGVTGHVPRYSYSEGTTVGGGVG